MRRTVRGLAGLDLAARTDHALAAVRGRTVRLPWVWAVAPASASLGGDWPEHVVLVYATRAWFVPSRVELCDGDVRAEIPVHLIRLALPEPPRPVKPWAGPVHVDDPLLVMFESLYIHPADRRGRR